MKGQRAYIATAGLIFAAIFLIHVARIAFEGSGPLHDPFFVGATIVALAAAIWSVVLMAAPKRPL
jgi:hypothetical protein